MKAILCLILLCVLALAIAGLGSGPAKGVGTFTSSQPATHTRDQVQGKPSISAAFINRVLALGHSPARGTGAALYRLGVQYGIDPAYALAFFLHESGLGTTGVAVATLSLGNIRCSNGYSCIDGFRAYASWEQGYRDWYRLILYGYVEGQITIPLAGHVCTTVEQIIPVYAPSSDHNDVAAYIAAIRNAVSTWRAGEVRI
jgi:Mannosyl-glycoprotein endo-beta-N-acetylglucosaminidase